jgi:hypothetical protein
MPSVGKEGGSYGDVAWRNVRVVLSVIRVSVTVRPQKALSFATHMNDLASRFRRRAKRRPRVHQLPAFLE